MTRLLPLCLVSATIVATLVSRVVAAKEAGPAISPAPPPVGVWRIEFANGVTELCDVFTFDGEGHAAVEEPQRRSRGRVESNGGAVELKFNDDRVERWTPVGDRFVVEHWFPGSRRATVTPVLGIAERIR